ncbi:MAG: cation-translocating P-type ATPase [Methanomassiliicoccus sp.]|nr:cation-translocating P-type ATPase [Methanomassiliicoccus sp.]
MDDTARFSLQVEGMDCIECAKKIEKAVLALDGVTGTRVSYTLGKVNVEGKKGRLDRRTVVHTVERLGYKVKEDEEPALEGFFSWNNRRLVITIVSGVLFVIGAISEFLLHEPLLYYPAYILAIVSGGYYIARRGIASIYERYLDMNVLMMVAVVGAVLISAWEEAASIVFLFSLAEVLESYSVARTRRSITELMDFMPRRVLIRRDAEEHTMDATDVEVGDVAIVKPGERIPVDGEVIKGESSIDESAVTGESVPVHRGPGDAVFSGTLNGQGAMEIMVSKRYQDTVIAKIVSLVEEAEASKAPTERFIDRFSRYYTPAVVTLAVATMFLPTLLFGAPLEEWFYRGLVLLVISCPCALVISTPVSVVSAISGGARRGVLFKGGLYLERMGRIRVVAFDKTGTLTQGRPKVEEVIPLNGTTAREVLKVAASAENRSEHHLARAIIERAREENVDIVEARGFTALHGKGVAIIFQERRVFTGSPQFFRELKVDLSSAEDRIAEFNAQGKTVILVGSDDGLMGIITVRDLPRKESKAVVEGLKAMGVLVIMLTGDDTKVAEGIAADLGIEEFRARLLPQDKVKAVEEYQARYGPLLMVGDGVNDAPALAKAEVGVAMGVAGTDVALEAADVALMGDDLRSLLYGMRLSRRGAKVIRQNVTVSLAVKLALTILTFPGLVTLWMAILIGDLGVSLAVIGNALRLNRYR